MKEIQNGNITPAMRLVQFAQENEIAPIVLQANIGKSVRLYVWQETEDGLESLYTPNTHLGEPFTHKMCDEWIAHANQIIGQCVANLETELRQAT